MIDVEAGIVRKAHILIQNDKIEKVVHKDIEGHLTSKAVVLNGSGKWLIPGLIDMHVHIKEEYAPIYTAAGVTTVRNTGGNVIELKKLIHAPENAHTPRVISADRIIDGLPSLWKETTSWNIIVDKRETAIQEVKRQAKAGAKLIKVHGGLSRELMEVVVEEAKKLQLEVSCDLLHSKEVSAIDAARMGIKWNEHASGIIQDIYPDWHMNAADEIWDTIDWEHPDEDRLTEICHILKDNGVVLCPTLVMLDQANRRENYWYPENTIMEKIKENSSLMQQWSRILTQYNKINVLGKQHIWNKKITSIYHRIGGVVVAGTDTPTGIFTFPGMALHRELQLMVQAEFSEMDALRAATIIAAKTLERKDIGMIKEGAYADLVLLNGNPLEDIRNTQEIDLIIKGGTLYTQTDILEQVPPEEYIKKKIEEFLDSFLDTNYKVN